MNLNDKASSKIKNSIAVYQLKMDISIGDQGYEKEILHGAIQGLQIYHKAYFGAGKYALERKEDQATFLLVLKGAGLLSTANGQQALEEESFVLLPNETQQANLILAENQQLHYLEFNKKYSAADKENLSSQDYQFDKLLYTRFQDCTPYTEKIKSPIR